MPYESPSSLKQKFQNQKRPSGKDFENFIDSCYSNFFYGDTTFLSSVTSVKDAYFESLIIKNEQNNKFKLIVTENDVLSAIALD